MDDLRHVTQMHTPTAHAHTLAQRLAAHKVNEGSFHIWLLFLCISFGPYSLILTTSFKGNYLYFKYT